MMNQINALPSYAKLPEKIKKAVNPAQTIAFTVTVADSSITYNTAGNQGDGIVNKEGTVTLTLPVTR